MEGGDRGIDLEEFEGNSAWAIIDTSWYEEIDNSEASITFVLRLKRKPLYSMLSLVFPVVVLAILDLFVFALPSESGEKAGYAVTVFLAFAVFLTIMEASFPQNSDTISIFAIYVVLETVQSTIITAIALIMIRVSAFEEKTKIPAFLICVIRVVKCKQIREKRGQNRVTTETGSAEVRNGLDNKKQRQDMAMTEQDESDTETIYTWKSVSNCLDVIFFIVFSFTFFVATMTCLLWVKYH